MFKWFANGADRTRKSWGRSFRHLRAADAGDCDWRLPDGECVADWQGNGDSSFRAEIWIALFRVPHGMAGAE